MNLIQIIHELEKVAPIEVTSVNGGYAAGFTHGVELAVPRGFAAAPRGRASTQGEAVFCMWHVAQADAERGHLVINAGSKDRRAFRIHPDRIEEFEEDPVPTWGYLDIAARLKVRWYGDRGWVCGVVYEDRTTHNVPMFVLCNETYGLTVGGLRTADSMVALLQTMQARRA